MKKSAVTFLSALLAFVCISEMTKRVAAQGKTAAAPGRAAASQGTPEIDKEKIRAHVKFLANDLLEGRGTGQRGGDIAAEYIATQFALYGLKPAGDNGTYFQDVPMVGVKTLPETTFKFTEAGGKSFEAKNLSDFVTNNESQTETADIDAPIVFVGYGIKAPEYGWDDYKNVDLRGKVALLFVNEPSSDDPNFFKGKALTYYGRWTYKFEETARSVSHSDHPPEGPRELRLGGGAQFVGNRALVLETRCNAEAAGGFMDPTGRGEKNSGNGGTGSGQDVRAGAVEGLQADAIADSSEGPRSEPAETVRLEKCFGDAAG